MVGKVAERAAGVEGPGGGVIGQRIIVIFGLDREPGLEDLLRRAAGELGVLCNEIKIRVNLPTRYHSLFSEDQSQFKGPI